MHRRFRSPGWPLFIFLNCLILLGACGSLPQSAEPARVMFQDPPLQVGLLHSLSGTLAISEIPVRDAALLAIDELNQAGGVLGRQIVPIIADGESEPSIFAAEAWRLLTQERVVALFGCWTSASRKAVLPVVETQQGLLWYPVQYEGLEQSPNVVYLGATTNQQIIPAVEYLLAQDKRRFFLIGSDYVFPRTANAIIKAQLAASGGVLVGEAYLPLGSTAVMTTVQEIRTAQPDIVFNTLNGDSNVAFFQQLRAAGLTADQMPTLSVSIAEAEVRAIGAETLKGHLAAWNYFQTTDNPANQAFVSAYQARYGERRVTSDPIEAMYIGIHLWAQAVTRAGSTDVDKVRAAMREMKLDAPEGMVTIDGATQHLVKTVRIGRVRADGQFEQIWSSGSPVVPDPFLKQYAWAADLRP
jgi:urea transport system substrate-binding protein